MGLNPLPPLGLHPVRDLAQLLDGKHVEQARILEETASILTEQVADDVAARLDIGIGPDEHRTAIIGGHVVGGHIAPNDPRLPVVMQVLEHLLLPGVVFGDGECHKLIQGQPVLAIDLQQLRTDSAKAKPLLHHAARHAEPRADFLRAPSVAVRKLAEPLELIGGVHRGPGHILVQTDLGRVVLGVETAANRVVLPDLPALGAQQIGQPATFASGDEIGAGRLLVLHFRLDHKVLDQTLMLDGSGQRLDGGLAMRHLAGVLGGLLELVQRHENLDARHRLGSGGFDLNGLGHLPTPWVSAQREAPR